MPDRSVDPVLRLRAVRKQYGGLRPLRIDELVVSPGERVSIANLDAAAAETLVNLATGAVLPDDGTVEIFGRPTTAISDSADWLTVLDRFGLVTDRIVLLEAFTVAQNLAVPFTLELEPVRDEVRVKVEQLASETDLYAELNHSVANVSPESRARIRLARALALDPHLLILEHPTSSLSSASVVSFAHLLVQIVRARQCAVVAITADRQFSRTFGGRRLVLHLATGVLQSFSRWSWR
jgi:predicted ABC-type transport system involved in lysophospholipase L1 biosynthesis ATPase subunit